MRLIWILLVVLAVAVGGYMYTRFEPEAPIIETRVDRVLLSKQYMHEFRVHDAGMGVERVSVRLERGPDAFELADVTYPGNLWSGADLLIERKLDVEIKPDELGLEDGPGTLIAEARDYSWRGNSTRVEIPVMIDTRSPRVSVLTGLTYARRGGSEVALYRVDEDTERDGIEVGSAFFPGFAHPTDAERRIAFFGLPPELGANERPRVVAEDRAGNSTRVPLNVELIERSFPSDEIRLSRSFMESKIAELIGGDVPEDVVAGYLKINRDMRAENAATIREITEVSSSERLWSGPFLQLPNSHVGARFAEHRTYTFEGRTVDEQTHLGYDLSSTAGAEVPAANDGVVAFAGTLGIYGETVIIDHGLGLFSLYGHLSEISVEKGSPVGRGESIGRTGQTGLAGGDHLHFSMILSGEFIDPLEWFDEKWIVDHVEPKFANEADTAREAPSS